MGQEPTGSTVDTRGNTTAALNSAQWPCALQGCLAYTGEMPTALNKRP